MGRGSRKVSETEHGVCLKKSLSRRKRPEAVVQNLQLVIWKYDAITLPECCRGDTDEVRCEVVQRASFEFKSADLTEGAKIIRCAASLSLRCVRECALCVAGRGRDTSSFRVVESPSYVGAESRNKNERDEMRQVQKKAHKGVGRSANSKVLSETNKRRKAAQSGRVKKPSSPDLSPSPDSHTLSTMLSTTSLRRYKYICSLSPPSRSLWLSASSAHAALSERSEPRSLRAAQ